MVVVVVGESTGERRSPGSLRGVCGTIPTAGFHPCLLVSGELRENRTSTTRDGGLSQPLLYTGSGGGQRHALMCLFDPFRRDTNAARHHYSPIWAEVLKSCICVVRRRLDEVYIVRGAHSKSHRFSLGITLIRQAKNSLSFSISRQKSICGVSPPRTFVWVALLMPEGT